MQANAYLQGLAARRILSVAAAKKNERAGQQRTISQRFPKHASQREPLNSEPITPATRQVRRRTTKATTPPAAEPELNGDGAHSDVPLASAPAEPTQAPTDDRPDSPVTARSDNGNAEVSEPGNERPRERRWEDRRPAQGQRPVQGQRPGQGGQGQGRQTRERRWEPRENRQRDGDRDLEFDEEHEDTGDRQRDDRRPLGRPLNIAELEHKSREDLIVLSEELGVEGGGALRKQDLIFRLLQVQAEARGNVFSGGFIEISDDGNYGFLRGENMLPGPHDIYVSQSQLRRFALRPGDYITGQVRHPKDNEKYYGLLKVETVNGMDPEVAKRRPYFENLTAIFPIEQMKLETTPDNLTHRLIDLVAPIGRGQRGLIVSPPKAGKTMLLKNIANGISTNYPDVHLMVLLIGERPEEVTDMQRSVRGEVVASTFDEPVEDHTRVAEMALERAKRLVEGGQDVVIMLDSITRLTRAYNLALPPSGRTLSGGVDPIALYPPKRLFGAARKAEEGGSLTIIATCLVDTGSRMDEVVFEEFKGTGNLELRLDRRLSERRFYPAIDIAASSTRREELLLDQNTLKGVWLVRRMTAMISQNSPNQLEAAEKLLERLARTSTNEEFLASLRTDL